VLSDTPDGSVRSFHYGRFRHTRAYSGGIRQPRRGIDGTDVLTAESVADIAIRPSYSPVLLVGAVRGMEFILVALTGFLVHAFYLSDNIPFTGVMALLSWAWRD
jgi:hypothetical protein